MEALRLAPGFFEAAFNLGLLFQEIGRSSDAVACYRQALQYKPDLAPAWGNLGVALRDTGRLEEAVGSFHEALRLKPGEPEVLSNLGNALHTQLRYDEAIACYREALRRAPEHPGIHLNLGDALRACGRVDEAIECLQQAVRFRPDFAEAHWALAFALLLQGDFDRGFTEYEWRWRRRDFPSRVFAAPLWQGEDLAGRTLLVHTEQGAGDSIQFVRFVEALARRGARVILECPSSLTALLASVSGAQRAIARGDSLPAFDFHVPLLSLPRLLGVTLASLPAATPYLHPPTDRQAFLPPPSNRDGACLKVGLAWRGNPKHVNDRQRSIPLACFEPLFALHAVAFYSLQVASVPGQEAEAAGQRALVDLSGQLRDFADTAFAISQLDLVIAVDTSVAHLAGALGRPAWVLLPFAPDWRWLLGRQDSPWYPTTRLFRQPAPGDWQTVIQRVHYALAARENIVSPAAKVFSPAADKSLVR